METRLQKVCLACGKELEGRADKKFCDQHCKSSFHYKKNLNEAPKFFNIVDNQLKLNRRILKEYFNKGNGMYNAETIRQHGFNQKYFTHYWKNDAGEIYLFVYEYGFLRKIEDNIEKYALMKWEE